MLLAAVVLPLEGEGMPSPRELQGWFYNLLKKVNAEIHDQKGIKPFTLGFLQEPQPFLRITFLDGELHAHLSPVIWDLVGQNVLLGSGKYRVHAVLEGDHPWAGLSTYPRLFQGQATFDYPMYFGSPTFFKRKNAHYPLPEPKLVFGSLLRRFRQHAPIESPKELDAVFDRVTFRAHSLRTKSLEHDVRAPGFVGRVVFHLPNATEEEARWLTALWRFSFFAGVGAKTTMGFGLVRPLRVKKGVRSESAETDVDSDSGRGSRSPAGEHR